VFVCFRTIAAKGTAGCQ